MKRSLITLIAVALFAGVGSAATYAIEDYVPNFGFDEGTADIQYLSVNGWGSTADQSYTWSFFKKVGESEAITGDKVLAFGNVADTGQPTAPAWAGWGVWMTPGDTWTMTLVYKKDPTTTSAADLSVKMSYSGGYYGEVIIAAEDVTDEWQYLEYSYTHPVESEGWYPNTWELRLDANTPSGGGAGGLYVDMVPEPATMAMFGSGAILALIRRRKK